MDHSTKLVQENTCQLCQPNIAAKTSLYINPFSPSYPSQSSANLALHFHPNPPTISLSFISKISTPYWLKMKLFLVIIVFMSIILSFCAAYPDEVLEEKKYENYGEESPNPSSDEEEVHELEGRSLRQKKQTLRLTCNKFPRICGFKGSPGPNCCKKKCVNAMRDRYNCGKCGNKCKFNQICCSGKCVNPSFNRRHCGGCNNSCSNGSLCAFGLCNYA